MPLPSALQQPKLRSDSVRRIAAAHGLGTVQRYEPLTAGYLNCNYRVETDAGPFFVKRHTRFYRAELRLQHRLLLTLQERGLSVGAPLPDRQGHTWTVVNHRPVTVVPWAVGEHRAGASLSQGECKALGELLGRTHLLLAELGEDQPQPFLLPSIRVAQAARRAQHLLQQIQAHQPADEFDRLAEAYLRFAIGQLHAYAGEADVLACLTRWQLTHGDFHQLNVIFGDDGGMTIVDWDRLRVQPRLVELVRALVLWLHDPQTGVVDVQRAQWVVEGYAARAPVEVGALASLVEHFWWSKLSDLWILDTHYQRGNTSADDLLPSTLAWLSWLAEYRRVFGEALEQAAARGR